MGETSWTRPLRSEVALSREGSGEKGPRASEAGGAENGRVFCDFPLLATAAAPSPGLRPRPPPSPPAHTRFSPALPKARGSGATVGRPGPPGAVRPHARLRANSQAGPALSQRGHLHCSVPGARLRPRPGAAL